MLSFVYFFFLLLLRFERLVVVVAERGKCDKSSEYQEDRTHTHLWKVETKLNEWNRNNNVIKYLILDDERWENEKESVFSSLHFSISIYCDWINHWNVKFSKMLTRAKGKFGIYLKWKCVNEAKTDTIWFTWTNQKTFQTIFNQMISSKTVI